MVITGYARRIDQDVSPGLILTPAIAASADPALFAAHCLEQVEPALPEQTQEGDVLVLHGQFADDASTISADDAVLALQALGIAAVVCAGAAAPLLALASSYGLPLLVHREAAADIQSGSIVRLDLERGTIEDQEAEHVWQGEPCVPAVVAAARRAQMLARMRRVVEDEGFAE
jgi:3-isopropylmalate/(R)-2-methylmalate dehydratase small subunit